VSEPTRESVAFGVLACVGPLCAALLLWVAGAAHGGIGGIAVVGAALLVGLGAVAAATCCAAQLSRKPAHTRRRSRLLELRSSQPG
jgi:hypothetical protein